MKRFRTVRFLTAISLLGAVASGGQAQSADAAAYSSNAAHPFSNSTFSGTDAGSASNH